MANTKIVCQGFTAAAWMAVPGLPYDKISSTSFNCTFNNTIIQSQAAMRFADSVLDVRRTKGPYIQDVPTIDLSISFEVGHSLFMSLLDAIVDKRNKPFKVKLTDHATGMSWEFGECYFTSFGFSVSESTLLSVSMGYFVMLNEINYDWGPRSSRRFGNDLILPVETKSKNNHEGVIPYYDWSLRYRGKKIQDVMAFEFGMTQSVEPKYECRGSKRKFAPVAENLLFGLPSYEFSYTAFKGGSHDRVGYYDGYSEHTNGDAETFHSSRAEMDADSITMILRAPDEVTRAPVLYLTGCSEISATPEWGVFPSVERKFTVNGLAGKQ